MTRIIAGISVSLDGFVAGPAPSPDNGLATATSGAVVLGRHLFDVVDAPTLHLAPIVPGAGAPLFTGGAQRTLVQRSVISASTATHLTYDVYR